MGTQLLIKLQDTLPDQALSATLGAFEPCSDMGLFFGYTFIYTNNVKHLILFIIFAALFMLDAFLAKQFMAIDIMNEANPIIRERASHIYLTKGLALVVIFVGLTVGGRRHPRTVTWIYYSAITMMVTINFVSAQMIG